jgi:transketolase
MLQGHPDMKGTPGIDMSSGSLGQGISAACGMALAAKISGKDYRVYAMLGDGECEEGQVWEAAMFASHYKLDNLVAIVDYNGLQIDGNVMDVAGLDKLEEKFTAFGFEVFTMDGHDFEQIAEVLDKAKTVKGKPTAIIAKTIKGKGVSYMENQVGWHGKAPDADQYKTAMDELNAQLKALEA